MPEPAALAASLEGPAGAPVLVLGNSLGTSRACWEPQVPALARCFRLLRYEHRGHGAAGSGFSPAPAGPYSVADLAGDVLALLDAHGVQHALYCGVSLGSSPWACPARRRTCRPLRPGVTGPPWCGRRARDRSPSRW
jgi:3-oxoadipate enol-lactonase